jgi:uncharacterized damage-inducible protein DinB
MPSIAQTSLGDLQHEMDGTRRVLERYPVGHAEFAPHPKSMTLGKLAAHVASLPWLGSIALSVPEFDVTTPQPEQPAPPTDGAGMAALFDGHWQQFKADLGAASDDSLRETWTLKAGDHTIMALPRVAVLRNLLISHMIHHRAQLTVYYRMLDVPVPGLYGPSADER